MVEGKVQNSSPVEVGQVVECTVEQVMPYGAFVRLPSGQKGMIHISELSYKYVKQVEDVIKANEKISAKIIKIDEKGRIDLSLKQMEAPPSRPSRPPRSPRPPRGGSSRESESSGPETFEKKLSSFLKLSETKIADLNNRANNARSGKKRSKKSK